MKNSWSRLGLAAVFTALLAIPHAGAADLDMDRLISPDQARALSGKVWQGSAAGRYLAGRLAQTEKEYGKAADFLEDALSWDPNNLELRRRVFLLMLADGRLQEALAHAYPLERAQAETLLPTVAQAAAAVGKKDYAAALGLFGRLDNNSVAGLIRLLGQAWSALGTGDITAARAVLEFQENQPRWGSMIAVHRALIEDVGGGDPVQAYAALADSDLTQSPRALDLLENFRARQDDTTVEPLVGTVEEGLGEGFFSIAAALNRGDRDLSALIYGQIGLAIDPEHDMLRLLVADTIADQERYGDAAVMFASIAESSPHYYDAQIARARNLASADRIEDARGVLQELADEYPEKAEAPSVMGDMLRRDSRFAEAVAAYDEAAKRLGEITAEHWRLLYSRGIALERSGNWQRAEQDLRTALSFEKNQAYVLNYLGYSWIDRGENLEEAKEMVRRAAKLRPKDGFIVDSLGWAHFRTGEYAEAVGELERAVTLEPLDPVINEHLGDAYWQVGREVEARFQWQRALNLEPEDELVPVLEEKLRCGIDGCTVTGKTD